LLFGGFGYAHLRLFSPVRSTIGFDRLFDLAETAQRAADEGYRPYDIERLADDGYQITLAVAGFSPDEISITAEQNVVTIEGGKTEKTEREFLYRGISGRHFKRQFNLADYVQVKGANFDNGLLKVELVREIPEAMKPRRIAISGASSADNSIRSRPRRRPDTSASGVPRVDRRAAPVFVRRNGGEHAADDHNVFDLNALLHPGTVFDHPREVLAHPSLSVSEKRAILASWAMHRRSRPVPRCGHPPASRRPSPSTRS
jgi:molecular chaperone IbpA